MSAATSAVPAPPPMSPEEMLQTVLALTTVLERENAALAAHDAGGVRALLKEKMAACDAYEAAMRALAAATGEAAGAAAEPAAGASSGPLGPLLERRWRDAAERLAAASAENSRRLAAAIAARKRLMQAVGRAARALTPAAAGYGRTGAPPRDGGAAPALSFNRAL